MTQGITQRQGEKEGTVNNQELLSRCRREMKEILFLQEQRELLRMSLYPRAILYTDKVQSTPEDYFSEAMQKYCDLDRLINKRLISMFSRQTEAQRIIDRLTDSRQREVLLLYYLSFREYRRGDYLVKSLYTWKAIAKKLHYHERQIRRIHYSAISAIKNI